MSTEQATVTLDTKSRSRIGEELDKNFMVEAAAGTGKTTCIVARMVNLIASGSCRIEHLAAVTFTRKAAAELRERFQLELLSRASKLSESTSDENRDRCQRLQAASDNCSLAFVGTIHSFCATLLRERPIEFGVDPAFRELDENEDAVLREQAWLLNLDDLRSTDDPLLGKLKDLGLDTKQLKDCFDRFLEYRDIVDWPTGATAEIDVDIVKRQTFAYIDHMAHLSPMFPVERGTDALMNLYEDILRARSRAMRSRSSFFQLLEKFDTTKKAVQKFWHEKAIAKAENSRFEQFRQEFVQPALEWWYRTRYQFVIDFLRRAVSVYERLKTTSSGLGFSDLLLSVSKGLKTNPALRRYFQGRYTHLLVDEFQDTDPVQAEMILFLTSADFDQQDWQKCSPRTGALFLVGDPKQSIYRFRRGDIVTYNRMKEVFLRSGGEVLKLAKNFRSTNEIIGWSNSVFEQKLPAIANKHQAASESMLHGRIDRQTGSLSGIRKMVLPDSQSIDDTTYYEADAIARFIRHAIDSEMTVPRTHRELELGLTCEVTARDFMIIPSRKKRIPYFKQALERYGIPCEVNGSNALTSISELSLLIDCLRAIDDAHNPVHFLAILRDRLFGFSDVDLYDFRKAGGRFTFTSPLPDKLDEALKARFASVNRQLSRYQAWLRALPFATGVTRIAEDLGLLASAASSNEGNIGAGGLLRAIESLRQQSYNFDSASDLISYFEQLLEMDEIEGATALRPDSNVVRVMNLHKAKGLESPIVFLADTTSGHSGLPNCHIDRSGAHAVGYMGITKKHGQYHAKDVATPPNWTDYQEEEKRFLTAESDRLLYVATTRAACMLVVSVGKEKSYWNGLHGHLEGVKDLLIPSDEQLQSVACDSAKTVRSAQRIFSKRQVEEKWTASACPSYAIVTAKDLGLKGTSRPKWVASGDYGYKWGSAVHELLEVSNKATNTDLRQTAMRLVSEYGLGSGRVDELLSTVKSVVRSEIWRRSKSASRCYSELPFETSSQESTDRMTIIRGVIDLIFEEPAGWVIVDYKTDDISEGDLPSAIQYYEGQIQKYAEQWQSTTGFKTSELGLYFTRLDRYVTL
jgi:ATP-dependent helicase/nuclease subunit A